MNEYGSPDQTGSIPLTLPSVEKPLATYYKVFGDLSSGRPPVVALHGGPGSGHEYMLPFSKLWQYYKIPVILFDQIGCGGSTSLQEKQGDKEFFKPDIFVTELENLLGHFGLRMDEGPGYHVLGHSWGGLLAAYFATHRQPGLRKLVLASACGSFDLHGLCIGLCTNQLSDKAQETMREATRTGEYDTPRYKEWEKELFDVYFCRAPTLPELLQPKALHLDEDMTVQHTMYGRSWLAKEGSMFGWECHSRLPDISVPTLVYHGEYDYERFEAVAPFVALIPRARYVKIPDGSHMTHLDSPEKEREVLDLVGSFLQE